MAYLALYRKFRPDNFDDVKGQDHIVTALRNQVISDRIAHAYLFCGTRGTGKTTLAKIMAKAVNCENPENGSPCGKCAMCRSIEEHRSMNVFELDAASNNGVDNVRQIVDEVRYSPTEGRYKVYIIDEVHMLSAGAFNALLKTLEEPPSYVIFILATTEVHKLPVTILSRCQRYDFRRIKTQTITERLRELADAEGVLADEKALSYIARSADGAMRDALSLLDQCISFYSGQELTYDKVLDALGTVDIDIFVRLHRYIEKEDVNACMAILDEVSAQGRELSQFVTDFTKHLRNLLLIKAAEDPGKVVELSAEAMKTLSTEAELSDGNDLIRYIRIMSSLANEIRFSSSKRIPVEVALIKLCRPETENNGEALLKRIERLEKMIESGSFAADHEAGQEPSEKKQEKDPVAPKQYAPIPEALPEDIRIVAENWDRIRRKLKSPIATYVAKSQLSVRDDTLILMTEVKLYYDMLMRDEHLEAIRNCIAREIGKTVKIEPLLVDKASGEKYDNPNLETLINFEIEYK